MQKKLDIIGDYAYTYIVVRMTKTKEKNMKRKGLKEALNMAGLLEGAYVRHTKGEIVLDGKKYMASLTFTDADDDDPHMEPNTRWRLTEI